MFIYIITTLFLVFLMIMMEHLGEYVGYRKGYESGYRDGYEEGIDKAWKLLLQEEVRKRTGKGGNNATNA